MAGRRVKQAKKATSHYAHSQMKGAHRDDEAYQKALAAAPDERSRQQVRRMSEVVAAASKKKLAV